VASGTTSPGAKLDVNGDFESDRFWYRTYSSLNSSTSAEFLDRDGNSLPNNFVALVFTAATGSNSASHSYWMIKRNPDGAAAYATKISSYDTVGGTPELYVSGTQIRIRTYGAGGPWDTKVRVEQLW